jgi:trans-aconitate methyltransferase
MNFDWDASKYASISDLQAEMGQMLIDKLQFQTHYRILDIGCGVGNLTIELAFRCNQGSVLGIDASSSMIEQAKTQASDVSNIEFRVLDAEHIQFQQEFDVVFSNSALHWVSKSETILLAIRKALKPDGRIALQFPLLNDQHSLRV